MTLMLTFTYKRFFLLFVVMLKKNLL